MITNEREIIEAAQIADIVGDFVTLQARGASLQACCPFHNERTPSFNVSRTKGIYKCFGCGKGGDSISFLKEQGHDYPAALRYIAKKYNIEVKEDKDAGDNFSTPKSLQMRTTASVVQAHFCMVEGSKNAAALKYWTHRGFTPETLDEFGIGYCDGSKPEHVADSELSEIGIINEKGNVSMYKRTTIPIHDRTGNVIAWAGRTLDQENKAKYINSPNTEIYNKSKTLFNLHRAAKHIKEKREIWIVEGYADVMAAWQSGLQNVVALCGTSLTDAHVAQIRKFNGEQPLRIVLALDNEITKDGDDEAAKTYKASVALAYFTAIEKLIAVGETVRMIYPKSKGKGRLKDIAEVVAARENLESCEKRDVITDYVERKLSEDDWAKRASPVERADFQEHVARLLAKVKRESVRDVYIKALSALLELAPTKLQNVVARYNEADEAVAYDILDYEYILIKDEIRQRYPYKDPQTSEISWRYHTLKKSTVSEQFGSKFIQTLPRFTRSVIEPSHTDYKRTLQLETALGTYNFFNDYEPLPFTPKKFTLPAGFEADPYGFDYTQIPEIKNIANLMRHIFDNGKNSMGDDFLQIAWDWLAVMYLHPRERLPAIGLVSKEEGTGKSTLINVFARFFGMNTTKIDSSRIAAKFNALMGGKVLVYCEETKDDRGQMENILKDLITGFEAVIEKKFGDAEVVPTFCKFLFASNHPDTFMKIGNKSTRFFVNEIKSIPEGQKVGNFEELCYMEIPYLAYFLQRRRIMVAYEDRLWFKPARYENAALKKLQQSSKDNVERNMEDLMEHIFLSLQHTTPILSFTSQDIMKMMIAYAGKKYETHTVNYFQDVCTRMGCNYTATTRRNTIEVKGLYGGGEVGAETKIATQGRFLEFPIWQFVKPEQILEIYDAHKLAALIKAIEQIEEKKPGVVPGEWLAALAIVNQPALEEALPF